MKKSIPAVLAALFITVCLAGGMFAVGGQSLLGSVSAASEATATPAAAQVTSTDVSQLQAQVAEYQAREVQYQAQLTEAASRIDTANQQIQQYQNVLAELQNSGLITLASDGTVTINQQQAFFPQFGEPHGDHH
jgi:peptidoglycan hydrolase CwlO-like protein